jgi:hypothetical protein
MNLRISKLWMYVGGLVMCLLLSACCKPILYKPTADPSEALLDIEFPRVIGTLSGFSAGNTKAILTEDQAKRGGDLREIIDVSYMGTSFRFYLCYTEETAKAIYLDLRAMESIFVSSQSADYWYFISYVERPRSDAASLCTPMDYYTQTAVFRFGNLIIDAKAQNRKFSTDMLSQPIEYVARRLEEYFKSKSSPQGEEK